MAKLMISMPDALLAQADSRARATGTTRSGYIQELLRRDLESAEERGRAAVAELLGTTLPLGGDASALIRRDRGSH